jgi:hypothetical protein
VGGGGCGVCAGKQCGGVGGLYALRVCQLAVGEKLSFAHLPPPAPHLSAL